MERIITQEIIDKFNAHLLEEERSAVTIEKYNRDIAALRSFADGRIINKELVIAYKQHLIESDYAERSVNSMLAAISSLFQFLEWYDCRVKSIKLSPEIYRPEEKELTQKEYERLVNTAMEQGREKLAVSYKRSAERVSVSVSCNLLPWKPLNAVKRRFTAKESQERFLSWTI